MTLVAFLFRRAPRGVIWAAFAGVASGLTSTGVLALVPRLVEGAPSAWSILGFVLLVLVSVVSKCASEILLVRLGQAGVSELRRNLSRDILEAPLERVESLGPARLLAALNEDVAALSQAFIYLPIVCVNAATVVGCLVYLGWIALEVLGIVLGALALGSVAFWMQSQNAERYFSKARGESDRLFEYFRGLVQGLKELKMQRERGELFLSERLGVSVRAYEREYVAGSRSFSVAMAWGNLLFFVALGVTVIGLPLVTEIGRAEMMAAALTLLFLLGPFAQVVEVLPVLSRANVALAHLRAIGLDLPREAMCQAEPGGGNGAEAAPEGSPPWREIQLSGVTHHYYREYEAGSFTLGPIELSLRPGEIVFLIGGNGSGKTTLSKLLLGLYEPKSGELRLDGRLVDDGRRDRYRGLFSTVFADYHLFSDLSGLERPEQRERARRYLERLKLDRTVRIVDGHFEFAGLSQGQRKRLALVVAALDDRPFYVFDEWASDQDPSFRRFFYTELLPELKARGKAVLVISHDDQYFGVADRCLRMDLGSVAEVRPGVSDGLQSVVSA